MDHFSKDFCHPVGKLARNVTESHEGFKNKCAVRFGANLSFSRTEAKIVNSWWNNGNCYEEAVQAMSSRREEATFTVKAVLPLWDKRNSSSLKKCPPLNGRVGGVNLNLRLKLLSWLHKYPKWSLLQRLRVSVFHLWLNSVEEFNLKKFDVTYYKKKIMNNSNYTGWKSYCRLWWFLQLNYLKKEKHRSWVTFFPSLVPCNL